ncbi:MAG: saccharopine dehydrogenase NADP-binding domain-containing protein, partial [Pseudomonadota bacterium]
AAEIGAESLAFDINNDLDAALQSVRPDIVIHTSGPYQGQDYNVARACIDFGCHYIDLADGRDFVSGIDVLDQQAKDNGVLVVSGASSVPCLTSALLDAYLSKFGMLEEVDYGITTAQRTGRGLATTAAILGYTGKPFQTLIDGEMRTVFGWQNIHFRKYREVGWRLLGNCDVPDLGLFPKRYRDLRTLRFYAGLELPFVHFTLWLLSWLVRAGVIRRLDRHAAFMLKLSNLFDFLGSSTSAFQMHMTGEDNKGHVKEITFEIIARSGDGPNIPCMPSILLARKLADGELRQTGALPCMGLITLEDYLSALESLDIEWKEF